MRAFLRISVVFILTAGALAYNAGDIVDPWHPWSTFGFSNDTAGVVTTVDEAARAQGLRKGDVLDFARMPLADRVQQGTARSAYQGLTIRLPLRSGKTVRLVAHTRPRSLADNVTDLLAVLALVAYTLIAAALVLLRPMPATWAFFIFSAGLLYNGNQDMQYFPVWLSVLLTFAAFPVLQAIGPIAFLSFVLRFPDVIPVAASKRAERMFWFVIAPLLAVSNVVSFSASLFGATFPPLITDWLQFAIAALYIPGIVVLIARYGRSARAERARLRWVVAAFGTAYLPYLFFTAAQIATSDVISLPVANLVQAWLLLAPLALAYTILKHRLFDIRFVASRALIYGFLTTLTVGVLALADWGFGKWMEQSRFQLIAEVSLALALGFSITAVHKRIEYFLNSIIFRAQTIALAAIRRFTYEVDLIGDPNQLMAQTLETLRSRLESEYVAIFTADGTAFVQSQPVSAGTPALLPASDLALLRLRRWGEPFECDVPGHPLQGALMLPMMARTQLIGFIVCGPKADRTHYIPHEIDTLQALAHRAGAGYGWLNMRALVPLEAVP